MRFLSLFAGIIAVLAVAAWATRPDVAAFDTTLKAEVDAWIARTDLDLSGDPIAAIALVGCKLRPSGCFDLIRQNVEVTEENRILYTRFDITAFGRAATCTGLFTKIWCDKTILNRSGSGA